MVKKKQAPEEDTSPFQRTKSIQAVALSSSGIHSSPGNGKPKALARPMINASEQRHEDPSLKRDNSQISGGNRVAGDDLFNEELELLYRKYFQDVFLYAKSLTHEEATAQDLTSETFVKAIEALPKFQNRCSIRVWLCQICKNTWYSRSSRNRELADDSFTSYLMDDSADPRLQWVRKEKEMEVLHLVHQLKSPYKDIFLYRVFGGLEYEQIAELYQKNANWACVTYYRSRQLIKEMLVKKRMQNKKDLKNDPNS